MQFDIFKTFDNIRTRAHYLMRNHLIKYPWTGPELTNVFVTTCGGIAGGSGWLLGFAAPFIPRNFREAMHASAPEADIAFSNGGLEAVTLGSRTRLLRWTQTRLFRGFLPLLLREFRTRLLKFSLVAMGDLGHPLSLPVTGNIARLQSILKRLNPQCQKVKY